MTNEKNGMPKAEHSPKLKMAASEIMEILTRYDIAGIALIHTIGFKEVVIKLDTAYSCVKMDEFKKLKIFPPIADPENPTAGAQKIVDTVNMVAHLQMTLTQLTEFMSETWITLRTKFGIMPKPAIKPPKFF